MHVYARYGANFSATSEVFKDSSGNGVAPAVTIHDICWDIPIKAARNPGKNSRIAELRLRRIGSCNRHQFSLRRLANWKTCSLGQRSQTRIKILEATTQETPFRNHNGDDRASATDACGRYCHCTSVRSGCRKGRLRGDKVEINALAGVLDSPFRAEGRVFSFFA